MTFTCHIDFSHPKHISKEQGNNDGTASGRAEEIDAGSSLSLQQPEALAGMLKENVPLSSGAACRLRLWEAANSSRSLYFACLEFRTVRRKVPLLSMSSLRKNKNSTEFVVLYPIDVIPLFATLPNWSSAFQPIGFHHIGPHMVPANRFWTIPCWYGWVSRGWPRTLVKIFFPILLYTGLLWSNEHSCTDLDASLGLYEAWTEF